MSDRLFDGLVFAFMIAALVFLVIVLWFLFQVVFGGPCA